MTSPETPADPAGAGGGAGSDPASWPEHDDGDSVVGASTVEPVPDADEWGSALTTADTEE